MKKNTNKIKKEYQVNSFFDESGITLSELISKYLLSFDEYDFDNNKKDDIIPIDIISNL